MCPLLSDDSQASHTPPLPPRFFLPFSNLSLPPHLSPFQPVPYLLNPASVTALNAKALPRQMIKVSSQFTLQCIDLMFPNLPGLSLMLPRTFRIFYTVPLFPGFTLYPSPSPAACARVVCGRARRLSRLPLLQLKIRSTEMFLRPRLHMNRVYIPSSSETDSLKWKTRLKAQRQLMRGRPLQNSPPFYSIIIGPHSPAVSNIVLE